ncbi:GNAT family N-acetyltransferase [Aquimarina sp. 2201CG1-2-11]|uniref:GNAT family N-acetyltransferase n=1 Tax=Aquimarina discodermiae TaxID=3231043 RepID=UPI003462D54C
MREKNIIIKKINTTDVLNVVELLKRLYFELGEEKESNHHVTEELISGFIKNNNYEILKASNNNNIIGFITLSESQAIYCGGKYGLIDELYVLPSYRSGKIGALLIEEAKKIGLEKKWMRIAVTAPSSNNSRALKFYKENEFDFAGPKLSYEL